jgi:hypothetical protein
MTHGRDCGGYYHEYFLRGKPFLAKHMSRVRIKGTGVKSANRPDQEPDFYKLPAVAVAAPPVSCASSCASPLETTFADLSTLATVPENVATLECQTGKHLIRPLEPPVDSTDWFFVHDCLVEDQHLASPMPYLHTGDSCVEDKCSFNEWSEHDWLVDLALDLFSGHLT